MDLDSMNSEISLSESDRGSLDLPLTTSTLKSLLDEELPKFLCGDCSPEEVPVVNSTLGVYDASLAEATGSIPCTKEYAGDFNFEIAVDSSHSGKKFSYSSTLNQVFVDVENNIPIQIKCNNSAQQALWIRALMIYDTPQDIQNPVVQCIVHKQLAKRDYVNHVIRCADANSCYEYNIISKRYSVRVPLDSPQPGTNSVVLLYSFHCKNSCMGKSSRRNTIMIFTLEDFEGNVLGRRIVKVRICSCPARDLRKEEKNCNTVETPTTKKIKKEIWEDFIEVKLMVRQNMLAVLREVSEGMIAKKAAEDGRPYSDEERKAIAFNTNNLSIR